MRKKKSNSSRGRRTSRLVEVRRRLETDGDWEKLCKRLRKGLDEVAVNCGAVKRWRKLRCATDLLRLALLYGFALMGLYTLVGWAARAGLVRFSAEALSYRLSRSVEFLGQVLGCLLQQHLKVAT